MTHQRTPGPWVAREQHSHDGKSLGWIIEHQNGRIGWSSYATADPNAGEEAPYPIGALNAFLIAAAPDLYEACKAALSAFENNNAIDWSDLERALAKAEGRTP